MPLCHANVGVKSFLPFVVVGEDVADPLSFACVQAYPIVKSLNRSLIIEFVLLKAVIVLLRLVKSILTWTLALPNSSICRD